MAEKQLAIIDVNDKDTFVHCNGTMKIHPVSLDFWNDAFYLKEFSLLDDASIKCRPRVIRNAINKKDENYHFEIEFTTSVPKTYQYEISLYYLDKVCQLKFANVLNAENIRKGHKLRSSCNEAFLTVDGKYTNEIEGNIILCSKICRTDSLNVLQQKSALHFSQVNDCSLLFENTALSNLTISVENREFKVHKEILAAKSSVFLAMFETEMKEKRENYVEIEDIEANIFQEFLRYIYTNTINDLNTCAEKLYKAADKYDLSNLKRICIDELSRSLNVENAVDLLSFADEKNETILKEKTMDFIKKHMKLIFQTEGYKALYQSPKAYLIHEIFKATFDYVDALK